MSTLTCEVGENAPPVCLFTENPNRLVSLWNVLRIYAANFVRVGACLEKCAGDTSKIIPAHESDTRTREAFSDFLETIRVDCLELKLPVTSEIWLHHQEWFSNYPGTPTYENLSHAVAEVFRAYQSEIRSMVFVHVKPDRASFLDAPQLFGEEVNKAFPSCSQEIADAGNCYAAEQDTACVMHLMRTLEVVLGVLAKEFGESFEREQWHNIIERIQKRANNLGPSDGSDWREKQTFYSNACSHFLHFKNAWRNHAMHARERYNGPEAFSVLDHVMKFTQILATRLRDPEKVAE
jgi:hypothetical protein